MKITLIGLCFLAMLPFSKKDISMFGLKIGDSQQSLSNIELKVVAKAKNIIKFKTENENDFSITCQKGKIVYMENDWLQDPEASQPLITDFQFGKTSLRDIRKKMGTNGFVYYNRRSLTTDKDLIQFNYFELDSPNNEILVTITKVPLNADVTEENVADHLKLDAIILADKTYCDETWGKSKAFDKQYKKIKL